MELMQLMQLVAGSPAAPGALVGVADGSRRLIACFHHPLHHFDMTEKSKRPMPSSDKSCVIASRQHGTRGRPSATSK